MRMVLPTVLVLMLFAAPALAQTAPRGYVQGIGGIASATVSDNFFGGAAAVRAAGPVDAFAEGGRLRNGIWAALDDEMNEAGDRIRAEIETLFGTATAVDFDARVPVTYGLAGARLRGPSLGPLGTYVEAGVGLARLRPEVELTVNGESIAGEAERLLELDEERTEVMSAAGAGVSLIVLRRIRFEAGYRFSRIHGDFAFNANRVHVGLGYAF